MDLGSMSNDEKNSENISYGLLKFTSVGTELVDCYGYKLTAAHKFTDCSIE